MMITIIINIKTIIRKKYKNINLKIIIFPLFLSNPLFKEGYNCICHNYSVVSSITGKR